MIPVNLEPEAANALSGAEVRVVLCHKLREHLKGNPLFAKSIGHKNTEYRVNAAFVDYPYDKDRVFVEAKGRTTESLSGEELLKLVLDRLTAEMKAHQAFSIAITYNGVKYTLELEISKGTIFDLEPKDGEQGEEKVMAKGFRTMTLSGEVVWPDKERELAGLTRPQKQLTQDGMDVVDYVSEAELFNASS